MTLRFYLCFTEAMCQELHAIENMPLIADTPWKQPITTRDFSRVSGVLRAEILTIPAMRGPELAKVRGILGGIPGESGI
jgi:hypothetical protein